MKHPLFVYFVVQKAALYCKYHAYLVPRLNKSTWCSICSVKNQCITPDRIQRSKRVRRSDVEYIVVVLEEALGHRI